MTIAEIKAKHPNYFDRATMRFFRSRVESKAYNGPGGCYFITSEQFVGSNGIADPRKYSVRKVSEDGGGINTVRDFNSILSIEDARAIARKLSRG